ncbi:hypothetical protein DFH07DRAFT_953022 [Mycena maculata]|uniref:Uncharacterized protein n=1 Tax=Mycena maculata TaxID=230809 RepID=A0AAD7NRT1_9AGAR|nr:hypothetical protein DFH07DRAFT_953022 [Mycena maculata]
MKSPTPLVAESTLSAVKPKKKTTKKSKKAVPLSSPTPYELRVRREAEHREKSHLRIAKMCAELKTRSAEEQEFYAQRARAYQVRYRERHREDLRIWEAQRRAA